MNIYQGLWICLEAGGRGKDKGGHLYYSNMSGISGKGHSHFLIGKDITWILEKIKICTW